MGLTFAITNWPKAPSDRRGDKRLARRKKMIAAAHTGYHSAVQNEKPLCQQAARCRAVVNGTALLKDEMAALGSSG